MAARSTEQEVREGFHIELHKHAKLLKLEFDKVESIVRHAYRMECDNEEIKELQNLKDAKMSLLRIKYNQEANLVVREFKDKVEQVLRRDATKNSNSATNAGESVNNPDRKDSDLGTSKNEEVGVEGVNQGSKNAENKALTGRTSRTRTETRARKYNENRQHQDSDAQQAAYIEDTKRFLSSLKNDPKETSDIQLRENRGTSAGTPKVQEKRLGKIIIKTGRNMGVVIKGKEGSTAEHAHANKGSAKEKNNTGRSATITERSKAEQKNDVQEAPKQKVGRRRREKQGHNDAEKPKEQEKPLREISCATGSDEKMSVIEKVRSSEEGGGESNIPGKDKNTARMKKAVKAKRGIEEEHNRKEAAKRKRRRKDAGNKESGDTEQPAQEKPSKKRKVTTSGNSKRRTAENAASSSSQGQRDESNTAARDEKEAERDQAGAEESRVGQDDEVQEVLVSEVQEVPLSNVRRSRRHRKLTTKAKEGKRS